MAENGNGGGSNDGNGGNWNQGGNGGASNGKGGGGGNGGWSGNNSGNGGGSNGGWNGNNGGNGGWNNGNGWNDIRGNGGNGGNGYGGNGWNGNGGSGWNGNNGNGENFGGNGWSNNGAKEVVAETGNDRHAAIIAANTVTLVGSATHHDKMAITERVVKGKGPAVESESEEEEEDDKRLEKRKKHPIQATQLSPQGEAPTKVGRAVAASPCATGRMEESPRLGVPGQRDRGNGGLGFPPRESALWEGAPSGEDFNTVTALKKAIRRFLSKKVKATIEAMCREAGVVYRARPEAVDELIELRVVFFSVRAPQTTPPPRARGGIVIRDVVVTQDRSREPPAGNDAAGSSDPPEQ
ncbi:hypothetical protein CBR_g61490 [Chara braunii]|uniref:Uncharacterized protein n=1 Tax=Chara braunii TaxID=69332 RepID=A0A388K8U1_CHABU|nr:hypothetical protein CBR_g61490 [Chara braunii]|eukprot:GBG66447.1 hypothetical protein CBR_g61490 [Chara braunii]